MFGLRFSSDSRTDIWRIQFICGQLTRSQTLSSPGRIFTVLTFLPFEVVVLLQGVRSNCRQDGDLSHIGFLNQLLCGDIQFRTLSPFPQFSEGFPWSDRYWRSLKSCSILFCGSHYPTIRHHVTYSKHMVFREPCLFVKSYQGRPGWICGKPYIN